MDQDESIHKLATLFAAYTNRNIFLTGKAGTGKTTFLRHLQEKNIKQLAVVAPTGVAAINAGGTTIHSFFQLPLTPFMPTELGRKDLISKMKMSGRRRQVIRELELLVIDEISMVRADVLDAIDTVLRHVRYRHNEPFGGVQVLFIGDMFQLSPVARPEDWTVLSRCYENVYFFNSLVYKEKPFVYIEFERVFRQRDLEFVQLLNEVRDNRLSQQSKAMLDARYKPTFKPAADDPYIILTTHNYKADKINAAELDKIKSPVVSFNAGISGEFPERNYPAEQTLELKKGARVMFLKNDTENPRRFYNGKIGTVVGFGDEIIYVKCPEDDENIAVSKMEWENIRYEIDESTLEIKEEQLGSFKQYPLRLAWAITIHKSQGLTFDKVVVDAEAAFAAGQVYVALSRCRALDGLVLQTPVDSHSISNDEEIVRFSANHNSVEQLQEQYEFASNEFKERLLVDIFDFMALRQIANRWHSIVKSAEGTLGRETEVYVMSVYEQITALEEVSMKFRAQLSNILRAAAEDGMVLTQRLSAAWNYYESHLSQLMETLADSPAMTDSREKANEYDEFINDIYTRLSKKKHWMQGINDGFDIPKYFDLRRSFKLNPLTVSAYSRSKNKAKIKSKHPQLMAMLFELRNAIEVDTHLPIYMIASAKTIQEIADFLPQTKDDLLRINGFGKTKYERFGEEFLDCVREYCAENNLKSNMEELFERETKSGKKKLDKPKQKKGDSALVSLAGFRSGKSIKDIAIERGIKEETVAGHLAQFIATGELDVELFVDKEKLNAAYALIEDADDGISAYSVLQEHFDFKDLRFILAWLRSRSL